MAEQEQPVFSIEKIHVKDLSLEIPHAPRVFLDRDQPEVNLQLSSKHDVIDEGMYEVWVTATITAKAKEKVMFLVEVQQAGICQIRNIPEAEIEPVLGITCPNILFPYLRETVSDIVTRAGFPSIILNPVNFEAIYHQNKQKAKENPAEKTD